MIILSLFTISINSSLSIIYSIQYLFQKQLITHLSIIVLVVTSHHLLLISSDYPTDNVLMVKHYFIIVNY